MSKYRLILTRSLELDFGRKPLLKTKVITDVLKIVRQNIHILVPIENVHGAVRVIMCREVIKNTVEMKIQTMATAMSMIALCKNISVTFYNVLLNVLHSPSFIITAVSLNVLMINRSLLTASVWNSVQKDTF